VSPSGLVEAVAAGRWTGRASQLSEDHVQWTFIDEIAEATRWARLPPIGSAERARGHAEPRTGESEARHQRQLALGVGPQRQLVKDIPDSASARRPDRALILQRRSAVAFDGKTDMPREDLFRVLAATLRGPALAVPGPPRVHLGIFVHRVRGLEPGLYAFARRREELPLLKAAMQRPFAWTRAEGCPDELDLFLLARGDARSVARAVSCHQEIAADGCASLGMITEFDPGIEREGAWAYRRLFWESGAVGQVLYLEAEAVGLRATGIGCFFDEPVHEVFGIGSERYRSLYHFTFGGPVDDPRLQTWPAYPPRDP
jgi:nitroreductase